MAFVKRRLGAVFALFVVLMLGAYSMATAMSVQPLLVEIEPGGAGSIRVENTRSEPLTVEVTVARRSVDEHGVQSRTPADDDFLILPPQAVIQPGRVQVVRLQWVGNEPPDRSISYFANIREVPVALQPGGGAQVQVAFAFDVAVHVAASSTRADLSLTTAEIARSEAGAPVMRLTIQNSGTRYAYLQNARYDLEVLNAGGSIIAQPSFTPDQLAETLRVTLLEPGKSRVIDLPLEGVTNAASVRGRVRAG